MINPILHVLPIQEDPPLPLAKIYILTDAYAKPILVITFFDTSSSVSILNPNILPDHYWKPHHQNYMVANGEKFVTVKISVLINIRLLPKCIIKRRLLGSSSHGKDLLIGFDILHKLLNLRWIDEQSRAELLSKFYSLVTNYGIMLSEKKIKVGPLMMTDLLFTMPNIALFMTGTRLTHPAEDHLNAYKWIEANGQWLYDNFDHYEVEKSDDDDDARSLWSSDDDEHFDPFEDDPTHPDAR
nr:reverse transcriptase domain, viral movement protein [Tanacetum cinerariifolium]